MLKNEDNANSEKYNKVARKSFFVLLFFWTVFFLLLGWEIIKAINKIPK